LKRGRAKVEKKCQIDAEKIKHVLMVTRLLKRHAEKKKVSLNQAEQIISNICKTTERARPIVRKGRMKCQQCGGLTLAKLADTCSCKDTFFLFRNDQRLNAEP
jgi:hypothetical protein